MEVLLQRTQTELGQLRMLLLVILQACLLQDKYKRMIHLMEFTDTTSHLTPSLKGAVIMISTTTNTETKMNLQE